eukprot:401407-Pyramimonas_sp.AAC.2
MRIFNHQSRLASQSFAASVLIIWLPWCAAVPTGRMRRSIRTSGAIGGAGGPPGGPGGPPPGC